MPTTILLTTYSNVEKRKIHKGIMRMLQSPDYALDIFQSIRVEYDEQFHNFFCDGENEGTIDRLKMCFCGGQCSCVRDHYDIGMKGEENERVRGIERTETVRDEERHRAEEIDEDTIFGNDTCLGPCDCEKRVKMECDSMCSQQSFDGIWEEDSMVMEESQTDRRENVWDGESGRDDLEQEEMNDEDGDRLADTVLIGDKRGTEESSLGGESVLGEEMEENKREETKEGEEEKKEMDGCREVLQSMLCRVEEAEMNDEQMEREEERETEKCGEEREEESMEVMGEEVSVEMRENETIDIMGEIEEEGEGAENETPEVVKREVEDSYEETRDEYRECIEEEEIKRREGSEENEELEKQEGRREDEMTEKRDESRLEEEPENSVEAVEKEDEEKREESVEKESVCCGDEGESVYEDAVTDITKVIKEEEEEGEEGLLSISQQIMRNLQRMDGSTEGTEIRDPQFDVFLEQLDHQYQNTTDCIVKEEISIVNVPEVQEKEEEEKSEMDDYESIEEGEISTDKKEEIENAQKNTNEQLERIEVDTVDVSPWSPPVDDVEIVGIVERRREAENGRDGGDVDMDDDDDMESFADSWGFEDVTDEKTTERDIERGRDTDRDTIHSQRLSTVPTVRSVKRRKIVFVSCEKCKMRFKTASSAVLHMLTKHIGDVPKVFRCTHCQMRSMYAYNLYAKHMTRAHNVIVVTKNIDWKEIWHPETLATVSICGRECFPRVFKHIDRYLEKKRKCFGERSTVKQEIK